MVDHRLLQIEGLLLSGTVMVLWLQAMFPLQPIILAVLCVGALYIFFRQI